MEMVYTSTFIGSAITAAVLYGAGSVPSRSAPVRL